MKLEFPDIFSKNIEIPSFMNIRPVGADEGYNRFPKFWERV